MHTTGCELGSRRVRSATFARKVTLGNACILRNTTDLSIVHGCECEIFMIDGSGKRESLVQCQLGLGRPLKVSTEQVGWNF